MSVCVVDIDGVGMDIGAHHGIKAPDATDYVKVGELLLVHQLLDGGFEKQLHAAHFDHLLQVFVYPMALSEKVLVQLVHYVGDRPFEVMVQEPGEHDHGCDDRDGKYQEDFKKVGFYDSQFCHRCTEVYHVLFWRDNKTGGV